MTEQIKKYDPANLDLVSRILEEEIKNSHKFLSNEELKDYIEDTKQELLFINPQYITKIWNIYEDTKIVGFTSVRETSTETIIVSIYVFSAYQKKGYGKKLLNKILSECKAPYSLAVYEENRDAYRFYENFGFKVTKKGLQKNHKYLEMTIS
ncbi:GNAT family N-acetyltransferase [Nostoc sp. JL33]|uniref:GNAT family N-acetyltransferase n=1 Tax=Nostoc sp. JL33 TaxID=2815396 RepID=UPI0026002758|nr:GNAT family N-acetyltransferase [Nostoc sp. JL33]MBN3870251.1 GNAT family N-acetyltransferase [Nostoc sp. JL33]